MKTPLPSLRESGLGLTAVALAFAGSAGSDNSAIPFSQIGVKATADYHGEALGITATADGAWLRCGLQKLEVHATAEGLWPESTAPGGGKVRLAARAVGWEVLECGGAPPPWDVPTFAESGRGLPQSETLARCSPGAGSAFGSGRPSLAANYSPCLSHADLTLTTSWTRPPRPPVVTRDESPPRRGRCNALPIPV
jgi:hypothetical protein